LRADLHWRAQFGKDSSREIDVKFTIVA